MVSDGGMTIFFFILNKELKLEAYNGGYQVSSQVHHGVPHILKES